MLLDDYLTLLDLVDILWQFIYSCQFEHMGYHGAIRPWDGVISLDIWSIWYPWYYFFLSTVPKTVKYYL